MNDTAGNRHFIHAYIKKAAPPTCFLVWVLFFFALPEDSGQALIHTHTHTLSSAGPEEAAGMV